MEARWVVEFWRLPGRGGFSGTGKSLGLLPRESGGLVLAHRDGVETTGSGDGVRLASGEANGESSQFRRVIIDFCCRWCCADSDR